MASTETELIFTLTPKDKGTGAIVHIRKQGYFPSRAHAHSGKTSVYQTITHCLYRNEEFKINRLQIKPHEPDSKSVLNIIQVLAVAC